MISGSTMALFKMSDMKFWSRAYIQSFRLSDIRIKHLNHGKERKILERTGDKSQERRTEA